MDLSSVKHLSKIDIIKNGSFFTPPYIIDLVYNQLKKYIDKETIIGDFGAGYGAFIHIFNNKCKNEIFGTEIDDISYQFLIKNYPNNKIYHENSLLNVSREKYNLQDSNKFVIIGNPPYNDVTSIYKKGEKGKLVCDENLKSRDLGISFLKAFSELEADFICVLHPLAYLIKKTNFKSLGIFCSKYKLIDGTIFSSKNFESIKKSRSAFPVVAALYKKDLSGMTYDDILKFRFKILNSEKMFCLNDISIIDGKIHKYPIKNIMTKIQFYTLRDMNALMRNKSFIAGPINNGVNVDIDNLYQYCWLYYLKKNFIQSENYFLYGDLSPLYNKKIEEKKYKNLLVSYAYENEPLISKYFNKCDLEKIYGKLDNNYNLLKNLLDEISYF